MSRVLGMVLYGEGYELRLSTFQGSDKRDQKSAGELRFRSIVAIIVMVKSWVHGGAEVRPLA